jgi:hypothetical protein
MPLLFDLISSQIIIWAAHFFVIAGIVVYVAGRFAGVYKVFAIPAAVAIFIVGIFLQGLVHGSSSLLKQIKEMEEKVKVAEQQSAQVNTVIQTRVVERVKVVKENTDANVQIVEKVVTKYDNLCTLSNAAVSVHNSASQNQVSRSTGSAVEGTTDVKISELIRTITENYGTYYQMREQLLGWQMWYNEQKKIYESVK